MIEVSKRIKENMVEKQKGITLLALVITIIVLLIIAGISISMLTGENGTIRQAGNAKLLNEIGTIKEAIDIRDIGKQEDDNYNKRQTFGTITEVLGEEYKKYDKKYAIEAGNIVYKDNRFSKDEIQILEENGIEKESKHYLIMNEGTKQSKYEGREEAITLKELQDKITSKEFSGEEGKYNKAYIIEDLDLGAKWDDEGNLTDGEQWTPITEIPENTVLDGCEHKIKGMYMNTTSGITTLIQDNKGTLENIILNEDNYIHASGGNVSGICNTNERSGIISKCENYADIDGGSGFFATGINVINYGKILDCINYGSISTKYCVAGISSCCESGSEIRNCVNYGTISLWGGYNAGGIVTGSYMRGPVKGTVSHCINYGNINGRSASGGIAAALADVGEIEYCANFGNISTAHEGNAGGIVGRMPSTTETVKIKNCYNTGDISSSTTNVGGITGTIGEIDRCYNIGKCFLKSVFYGTNLEPKELNDVKITNSYYLDQEIEGGKTIDEIFMKSQEFVDMLNTDSETGEKTDTYVMDTRGINDGYPILKWQLEM